MKNASTNCKPIGGADEERAPEAAQAVRILGLQRATNPSTRLTLKRNKLRHTDPVICRQVEVPTSITLKILHDIIQVTMGRFDYHLWEFTIGKQRYGLPMKDDWGTEPRIAAGKVRLRDVLKPRKTIIDYTYDFGDGWEHRLATSSSARFGAASPT